MWFFMITCYILTALSFCLLIVSGLQGVFQFQIFHAPHPIFALLAVIIYLFTETLVIFFFVGTGVSIRDYTFEHKFDTIYRKRSLATKRRVYPPILLNMFMIMALFISGGAVDTRHLPGWLHGLFFLICMIHFIKMVQIQHQSFREETAIILEMSGITPQFTAGR